MTQTLSLPACCLRLTKVMSTKFIRRLKSWLQMKFTISASPVGPLSILTELPDSRLAILEGLNGIGKTLAVRLLEICTGGSPYRDNSPAWVSLCSDLGEFTVVARNLVGAQEVRWVADSRAWLSTDARSAPGPESRFQKVTIDGRLASLEEVRRLLVVHRVGGEEGITETLAGQLDSAADAVRRWRERYAHQTTGPLAVLENALHDEVAQLGHWTLPEYMKLVASTQDARTRSQSMARQQADLDTRVADLQSARSMRSRLNEMTTQGPELLTKAQTIEGEIQRAQSRRDEVHRRVQFLAAEVAAAEPLVRELENAQRAVANNRAKLSETLELTAGLGAELQVQPDSTEAAALARRLAAELKRVEAERAELDAAPAMRGLLDALIRQLGDANAHGLGDQVAIDDPVAGVELSVAQTQAGMSSRREYLEGQPPPPQARAVIERQASVVRQLDKARRLMTALEDANRHRRLLARNEDRVNTALNAMNPKAIKEIRVLEDERRQLESRLLQLAAERAALHQALGAVGDLATQRALNAQYANLTQRLEVGDESLDSALDRAIEAAKQATGLAVNARNVAATLRRDVARADVEIRDTTIRLRESSQLGWLRRRLAATALQADASSSDQLVLIDRARAVADHVAQRLAEFRGQVGAVEGALATIGNRLRRNGPEPTLYVDRLEEYFNRHFSEWFNNPLVRRELLPKAQGDIRVDLAKQEVLWSENGRQLSRPLGAFSSGEQAFAYTRAQLAVLDEQSPRPQNRLIVLDEFGAFIAHDRLTGLLAYLTERASEHPNDQVLIVLPLSRDYAELAASAIGPDRERFDLLARQISERQYAVQPLSD
jgi:hypothetical protein